MESSARTSMWAAVVAAAAALAAAGITAYSSLELKNREELFANRQHAAEFLEQRLTKLYIPVSMHLAVTNALFTRFMELNTSDKEKTAIEHELHDHNSAILKTLLESSVYTESSSAAGGCDIDAMITQLTEHLVQWETVYNLKYEHRAYTGPVFAGISEFGFRGFPQGTCGADTHFRETTLRLRRALHDVRQLPR